MVDESEHYYVINGSNQYHGQEKYAISDSKVKHSPVWGNSLYICMQVNDIMPHFHFINLFLVFNPTTSF